MIVVIAGMPRSGSTFTFNVVRQILLRRGSILQEPNADLIAVLKNVKEEDHVILKAHDLTESTINFIKQSGIRTICSIRKPEDAIASWMYLFGHNLNLTTELLLNWLKTFHAIRENALLVDFSEIDRSPRCAISDIGNYILGSIQDTEIDLISKSLSKINVQKDTSMLSQDDPLARDVGFSYYNAETFFHRGHVTSLKPRSGIERLGISDINQIRTALSSYVDDDGNLRRFPSG